MFERQSDREEGKQAGRKEGGERKKRGEEYRTVGKRGEEKKRKGTRKEERSIFHHPNA